MRQTWERLLFAHWPLPPAALARFVPAGLTLDTRDGAAWLAITPFELTGLRLRGLPGVPGASSFPEINVRTYVTAGDRSGVLFLSLDAGSLLAVGGARMLYRLPYFHARFSIERTGSHVSYTNRRLGTPAADFSIEYEPIGPPAPSPVDSLPWWLTERYSLYTSDRSGLHRADIEHPRWPLQPARAAIVRNTMADSLGIDVSAPPALVHFAEHLDVRIGALQRLSARRAVATFA